MDGLQGTKIADMQTTTTDRGEADRSNSGRRRGSGWASEDDTVTRPRRPVLGVRCHRTCLITNGGVSVDRPAPSPSFLPSGVCVHVVRSARLHPGPGWPAEGTFLPRFVG